MHWAIWSFELRAVRNDWHFCETEAGIRGLLAVAGEPVAAGALEAVLEGGSSSVSLLEPKQTDACGRSGVREGSR